MDKYTALVIDIKKSKSYSIEARNEIQNYIISVIKNLNDIFMETLLREVDFSGGDEVQGLFRFPEAGYLYYRLFSMFIFPVEVRAGIGVGEWSIKIENAGTTAQDGPVYHNARKAIENVKNAHGYPLLIYSGGENDIFLNSAMNMPFLLTRNHSEYQNEIILLTELLYPINFYNAIDEKKIKNLSALFKLKNELNFFVDFKKNNSVNKYPIKDIEHILLNQISTDAQDDNMFFVNSGKKKGMAINISDILGISRQSIEKTYKVAKVYEARNAVIVALKLMDKYV